MEYMIHFMKPSTRSQNISAFVAAKFRCIPMSSSLHKNVLQFVHFICLWSVIVMSTCYAQHGEQFRICSDNLFSCGGVQGLSYPFWGGDRPKFCGHHDFHLTCQDNEYPIIRNGNNPFRVLQVNQSGHTISLSRFDLQDDFCNIRELKNASFGGLPFDYTGLDVKPLYMYYDCGPVIPLEFSNFSCEFEGRQRTGFYTDSLWGYGRFQCDTSIHVWVTLASLDGLISRSLDLREALNRGFLVNYNTHNTNCSTCEGSGGICGSDLATSEFICVRPVRSSINKTQIAAAGASVGAVVFLTVLLLYWLTKNRKGKRRLVKSLSSPNISKTNQTSLIEKQLDESETSADLPFFSLSTLVEATDSFSINNKLGQGGFGSVYKGTLKSGQEIAVKRLSKNSGQGAEEFKNEATLIAKLQHRNLVRLLGYCVQREEKILIYEYLPNKSLDFLIFDNTRGSALEWGQRFSIIMGITRGLVYLHHDSRLKIIHRDLKASNVLLDATMNPKISDFGMARIFGGDQIEANTNRVVGTYGYMSPEYAMEGLFSTKSDVFSFGVLLLEMISSRKNSSYHQESSMNLIGHVWDLWREGRALEMVDPSLGDSYSSTEVLRCIHVGLLSVQEQAIDRPTMSEVANMLSNETALPPPKQPAFIFNKVTSQNSSPESVGAPSSNYITLSVIEAR